MTKTNPFKAIQGDVEGIKTQISWLQNITVGALIALAVGFIAIFISAVAIFYDAFNNKASSYLELNNQVRLQSEKIDELTKMLTPSSTSTPTAKK